MSRGGRNNSNKAIAAAKAKAIKNELEKEVEVTRILSEAEVRKTRLEVGYKSLMWSVIAICGAASIYFVSGKTTNADINVDATLNTGGPDASLLIGIAVLGIAIGVFGVVYGRSQNKLRSAETTRLAKQKAELERIIDEGRTSSEIEISNENATSNKQKTIELVNDD